MNNGLKLDSIFSRQGSVSLACQSQREGLFREYFGDFRGGGGDGGLTIFTLKKCYFSLSILHTEAWKRILCCAIGSKTHGTAWWFLLRNILVIFL